jgi:cell division protein FtsN
MATTHRTASGKSIDMAALVSKNEKVRAISNVPMNAKGDLIDSNNNVVSPVSQRVARTYNKTTLNPTAQQTKNVPTVAPAPQVNKAVVPTPSPAPVAQAPKKEEPPVVFLEDMSDDEVEYFDEFDAEDLPPKADIKPKKK